MTNRTTESPLRTTLRPSRIAWAEPPAARRTGPGGRRVRRLATRKHAVSDVIGNILVLGITVVMFSSVFLWVNTLPPPRPKVGVTFSPGLELDATGGWVNVTHSGGESLKASETNLRVIIDGTYNFKGIADGGIKGLAWDVGETWALHFTTITASTPVHLDIQSNMSGEVLLDVDLQGGTGGGFPPFILDIWTLADGTSVPDKLVVGDDFTVYARVYDPDGDLVAGSVYIDSPDTPILGPWAMFNLGGGMYSYDVVPGICGDSICTEAAWTGMTLTVNATDQDGHADRLQYTIVIDRLLKGDKGDKGDTGASSTGGGGGNGTWNSTLGNITFGYSGPAGDFGYDLYNESGRPSGEDPGGNSTRNFIKADPAGARVWIYIRSTVLQYPTFLNSFILYNASTGAKIEPYTREYDALVAGKTEAAFTQNQTTPYFEYRYTFTVNDPAYPLPPGSYPIEVRLKDNVGHTFITFDQIWVIAKAGDPIPKYPSIATYLDPNKNCGLDASGNPTTVVASKCNDLVATTSFSSSDTMYVRVFVKDKYKWTDTSPCAPPADPRKKDLNDPSELNLAWINAHSGDVEVLSLVGGIQVKQLPGNAPVGGYQNFSQYTVACEKWTNLDNVTAGEYSYLLAINLSRRTQDQFVGGTNWYVLRVRTFMDCNDPPTVVANACAALSKEEYTGLTETIRISAPASVIDLVAGTRGGGGGARSLIWFDNTYDWIENMIESPIRGDPIAVASGDIDGDARDDVVVAQRKSGSRPATLAIFYNVDFGKEWRRQFLLNSVGDDWETWDVAIGDLDLDGDGDLVAGMRCNGGGVPARVSTTVPGSSGTTADGRRSTLRPPGLAPTRP